MAGDSGNRHVRLQLETPAIRSGYARRICGRQRVDAGGQNYAGARIRGVVDRGIELFNVRHVDRKPSTCGLLR